MLSVQASQLLPVPGTLRRVLAASKNRTLLNSMTLLFSSSKEDAILTYMSNYVTVFSDMSESGNYYHIREGVLPSLALLGVNPQLTVSIREIETKVSKKAGLQNYSKEFDISTNYSKSMFYHGLIDSGFRSRDLCHSFGTSRTYLSKSKALLSLADQYLSLFISGRIDDVNLAYDLKSMNSKQELHFSQLLKQGYSPRTALKIILKGDSRESSCSG
ncbi:hypothetical protein HX773_24455 [Pantoea sp. B9002]|uniref:hypothetical protein n=1 Tax=Pantoea sp. B9002 TaxID=2726979 RepID=UPI0015A0190A|nr:hypothetical protein [Pantoea sp. B9002]NWA64053.1 hypothetical protein [Pantoea sp. B9002]